MKIIILSNEKSDRIRKHLNERYGVLFSEMNDWLFSGYNKNVWVLSREIGENGIQIGNIYSAGLLFFTDEKNFSPTSNGITFLGNRVRKNIVEIHFSKMDSFFLGEKIPIQSCILHSVDSNGWVSARCGGIIVGSALLTQQHLIPNLPPKGRGSESEEK